MSECLGPGSNQVLEHKLTQSHSFLSELPHSGTDPAADSPSLGYWKNPFLLAQQLLDSGMIKPVMVA
jgi:hypothetical protein